MDQSLKGEVVSDYKAKSCRSCCLTDKPAKGLLHDQITHLPAVTIIILGITMIM